MATSGGVTLSFFPHINPYGDFFSDMDLTQVLLCILWRIAERAIANILITR